MAQKLKKKFPQSIFEQIRRIDENENEYWTARDLAKVLGYTDYRNFSSVIEKAKEACKNSGQDVLNHFVELNEMVEIGSGAKREISNIKLSRYACYLIVQNADPAKEIVALGQTYFAVQTRIAEVKQLDEYNGLSSEEEKRLFLRKELSHHNIRLAGAAKAVGIVDPIDYAIFQDHGYKGLYGGLGAKDIHAKKGIKKNQKILDHMGSTELAANLFRATQAEDKLRREEVKGKKEANMIHYEVGVKVRETIKELGGTMPEDLPAEKSIKSIEAKNKKMLDKN